MVMIQCESSRSSVGFGNTVHMCAERRLIHFMKHRARIEGVSPSGFYHWFHRKIGRVVIWRMYQDGGMGTSVPCILCRKIMDRGLIDWNAHIGTSWHSNRDLSPPKSKFTFKQMKSINPNLIPPKAPRKLRICSFKKCCECTQSVA
jgi:hypothetical protein